MRDPEISILVYARLHFVEALNTDDPGFCDLRRSFAVRVPSPLWVYRGCWDPRDEVPVVLETAGQGSAATSLDS